MKGGQAFFNQVFLYPLLLGHICDFVKHSSNPLEIAFNLFSQGAKNKEISLSPYIWAWMIFLPLQGWCLSKTNPQLIGIRCCHLILKC